MRLISAFLFGLLVSDFALGQGVEMQSALPLEVWEAVHPVLEAARGDSLPMSVLESKILEGVAKGVSAERIRVVSSGLAGELRSARAFLRSAMPSVDLTDAEVAGVATAIRQGVSPSELLSLWENRPASETLEIPLAVVGELARRGISSDHAVQLMNRLMQSGTPLHTAAQIPAKLDIFLPGSNAPETALQEAVRSLGIPVEPGRGRPQNR